MSDTERLGYRADKDALQVMQGDGDADARPHNREPGMLLQLRGREDSQLLGQEGI